MKKIITKLIDDLVGGEADETVGFSLDGVSYEIDLNGANAEKLRGALGAYVKAGRRQSTARPTPVTRGRPQAATRRGDGHGGLTAAERADIRTWARAAGKAVSERGRIGQEIIDQYRIAMRHRADAEAINSAAARVPAARQTIQTVPVLSG